MAPLLQSPHPSPSRPTQHLLSSNIPPTTLLEILHEALLILDTDISDLKTHMNGGNDNKEITRALEEMEEMRRQMVGLRGDMAWLEEYIAREEAEKGREKCRNEGAKARTAMLDGNGNAVRKRIVRLGGYGTKDGIAGEVVSDDG